MRFIPTNVHGIVDYLIGGVLIASPWLFKFTAGGAETSVAVNLGITVVCYSLVTNYEWSFVEGISVRTHLRLDILLGALLAFSPWVLNFHDDVFAPHVVFGIINIMTGMFTEIIPGDLRLRSRTKF